MLRDIIEATIDDLDQEADRLADRLEEHMIDKRKRDFEIRLLKGDLEKRKTYPNTFLPTRNVGSRGKGTQKRQGKTPSMP